MYLKGIFFFDSQPPLGKQLIAMVSYLTGYTGDMNFTGIGAEYPESVPLKSLRMVPAICGSLLVPVVYHMVIEMGLSHKTATIAGIFYILENCFLTQSRFVLMDTIQIFLSMFGLFALLKSRRQQIFSSSWFFWILSSSTFLALGACVKFTGLYTLVLALGLTLYDFWWLIPDQNIPSVKLWLQAVCYLKALVVWPIMVYIFIFWIHLSWLTKAGPHDNILTSAFQASLEVRVTFTKSCLHFVS